MSSQLFMNFLCGTIGVVIGYLFCMLIYRSSNNSYRVLVGFVILFLVSGSAVLNYRNSVLLRSNAQSLENSVSCQRKFNETYRGSLQAQLNASKIEAQATSELLDAFRASGLDPATRAAVFSRFKERQREAELFRTLHPLPVDNTCD
jgi:hypothetical protein